MQIDKLQIDEVKSITGEDLFQVTFLNYRGIEVVGVDKDLLKAIMRSTFTNNEITARLAARHHGYNNY